MNGIGARAAMVPTRWPAPRPDEGHRPAVFGGSRVLRLLRFHATVLQRSEVWTQLPQPRLASCDADGDLTCSSSIQLRAWTATSASVAQRPSAREHSPLPMTCLNLPVAASARARLV